MEFEPYGVGFPVQDLGTGILDIVRTALLLVGVLALGFLVYGGFLYITSQGDQNQLETAKSTVTHAVIGIAVIGLAYAIVAFVFRAFYEG